MLMNHKALSTNLTWVLEALHGKLDIKRHSPSIFYLSVTSHINCIATRWLINIIYLTACAFIRSWWRCTFEWCHLWRWIKTKIENYVIIASLKSETMGKLNPKFVSFDIKDTRLGFENVCWIARDVNKSSLQCYSVLSTIAQVLRKISSKILASLFLLPHLSKTFESYQRVKIYTYSVNELGLKKFSQ